LEYRIGYSLFERPGRRFRLTTRGHRLLRALRRSMLLLDDAFNADGDPVMLVESCASAIDRPRLANRG
jgi:DNA-binding transcriptional LysR family regulator